MNRNIRYLITELKSLITKRIRNLPVGQIVRFLQTPSWICVILSFELLLLFLIIVGRELESNQQVNEHFPQDPHSDQSELPRIIIQSIIIILLKATELSKFVWQKVVYKYQLRTCVVSFTGWHFRNYSGTYRLYFVFLNIMMSNAF